MPSNKKEPHMQQNSAGKLVKRAPKEKKPLQPKQGKNQRKN